MSVLGADRTRARVVGSRGWGRAGLLATCALLVASGACNQPLEFGNKPGTGGGIMLNVGDGSADKPGTGGTGAGGIIGTGGIGTGGVIGTGGAGMGGSGMGGSGTGGAGMGGSGMGGSGMGGTPGACTTNAQCSRAGLVCLTSANRCVECLTSANCTGNRKCTTDNRCVDCLTAADCPVTLGTNAAEHSSVCLMSHCLNGCSDDVSTSMMCPLSGQTCVTGSMGSGPDLCLYCTPGQATCGAGLTCVSPGLCVQCPNNACPTGTVCDTAVTQRCHQCRDSRDCPASTPLCNPVSLTCI